MIKTFAFLSLLFHVSFQQLDVALMENNLQSATNLIIAKEKKVSSTILSCRANAAVTSSNFKAINASKFFTNSFDAMANLTIKLQTVKEFEGFTKCDNLTTCECISFRMTLCDAQIKEIDGVIQSIYLNASLFYQTLNDITWSYMLDYKPIQFKWTREVAVLKTLNQSRLVMNELSDFNRVIFEIRKYFVNAMDYIESQGLNCSAGNSTFFEEGNLIEYRLRECEDKLLNLTLIALEKVNISLNTVATSAKKVKASVTAKSSLGSLKSQLEKQKTCKDYRGPKVSWPRIPDTSGRATGYMKVRTCKAKKESYSFTKNSASANQTKIKSNLDDFKNSTGSTSTSSIQKRAITLTSSSQDIDVITATTNVLNQFDVYIQELNLAMAKVDSMMIKYEQQMLLNTSICSTIYQVKNSNNQIVKSICYRSTGLSAIDATAFCRSNGMELYGITTVDDFNAILRTILNIGVVGATFIVNGFYNQTLNAWVVQYADRNVPLFEAAIPPSNSSQCLKINTLNEGTKFLPFSCTTPASNFCEFGWTNVATPVVITPNLSVCDRTYEVKTVSGLRVKRICIVNTNLPPNNSRTFCQNRGMEYYGVTNYDEYAGLLDCFKVKFQATSQISINGVYDNTTNKWLVKYKNKDVDLYPAAVPQGPNWGCLAMSNSTFKSINCTQPPYFLCEYDQTEAKTPICRIKSNIVEASTGTIFKKICVVSFELNRAEGSSFCKSNGMQGLFAIRYAPEFIPLKNFLVTFSMQVFGRTNGIQLTLDGKFASNGSWFINNPNAMPLYSGALPVSGTGEYLIANGTASSTFDMIKSDENVKLWTLCELDVVCNPVSSQPLNTTENNLPCGTFLPYDSINGRRDPEFYGFPSGINNRDGTVQFVGTGYANNGSCAGYPDFSGFISTRSSFAGAYMPCQIDGVEVFNPINSSYLAYSPKLEWVDTTMQTFNSVTGTRITLRPNNAMLQIGRACVNGQIQVGRIHVGASKLFIHDSMGMKVLSDNASLQVLVCNP